MQLDPKNTNRMFKENYGLIFENYTCTNPAPSMHKREGKKVVQINAPAKFIYVRDFGKRSSDYGYGRRRLLLNLWLWECTERFDLPNIPPCHPFLFSFILKLGIYEFLLVYNNKI